MMTYTEAKEQAGEFLRLSLNYLAKYDLPANPVNYTIWYEYVSGKNPKLKKAIDKSFKNAKVINNSSLENLYQNFIADGDRIVVSRLLTKISLMLKDVSGHVTNMEGDISGHGQNLQNLAGEIEKAHDYEDIKNIVDKMLVETRALVRSGKKLQARMRVSSEDLKLLHKELEKSQKEAQTDALTTLINRRGLETKMELERIRAKQNSSPFSIIMIDIDYFKKVNDKFGHLVGDSLLKNFALLIKDFLRQKDTAARYGGEEFLVLLPDTGINGAKVVAEKIKKSLAVKEWKIKESGESMGKISASMGISLYRLNEPEKDLIERADKALYHAKESGRNKVVVENEF